MKRCFIFGAGSFYGLRERPTADDFVVAADAGYRCCRQAGIRPDLLVGDFDSMAQPEDFADVLRVPVEKDDTDTVLAARQGLERGCDTFYIYGGTGGTRLDHTLANLQLLLFLRRRGVRAYLYDRNFVFTAAEGETLTIRRTVPWGLLSVFCADGPVEGLSLRGVQYPLADAPLQADFPLGVSNHILEEQAEISVRRGALFVGWQLPEEENAVLEKE